MEFLLHTLEDAVAWDTLIVRAKNYTFFHSMAWAKAIVSTYGFRQRYIAVRAGDAFAAIPLMIVRRPMSRSKAICLPFSDFCGPVFTDPMILDELMRYLRTQVESQRWKELEIKEDHGISGLAPCESYYEHLLPLEQGIDSVFRGLRPTTRQDIRRAEREGVTVQISREASAMDTYYRLHCLTRRRLGSPPQPKEFFHNIHQHVIQPGNGLIVQSRFQGRTIASSVFLHFGNTAVYKFGASLPGYERLSPSKLALWEAIRWYVQQGFSTLSFGRTDPENVGLMKFKNGWGGECREISYRKWPQGRSNGIPAQTKYLRMALPIVRALPVPALRLVGDIAYRLLT
jgi:CelD/BcsL family acetyltransferase involved in cellulose biosynthesis